MTQSIAKTIEVNLTKVTNFVTETNLNLIAMAFKMDALLFTKAVELKTEDGGYVQYKFDKRNPEIVTVRVQLLKNGVMKFTNKKEIDYKTFTKGMKFEEACHIHANTPAYWG